MTVADKIRSLDDDSLAEWLTGFWVEAVVKGLRVNGVPAVMPNKSETRDTKKEILRLLKEELSKNEPRGGEGG